MSRAQDIVRRLLGEDVPVPVGTRRHPSARTRERQAVRRRTAAAIMGLAEADEPEDPTASAIIPDEAEEYTGASAIPGLDDPDPSEDQPAKTPPASSGGEEEGGDAGLIPPKTALVAPDLTPRTLEPLDPSDVPQPEKPAAPATAAPAAAPQASAGSTIDPLDVLLGRRTAPSEEMPQAQPVTTEAAQAAMNAALHTGAPEDLMQQGRPMPDPVAGNSAKIMETFSRFTRKR
jgi:hypothetical protein